MKIFTLTTDTDRIATSVHLTQEDVFDTLRSNLAPDFEGGYGALVFELTERRGVVLYIQEHTLPPLAVMAVGNPFDGLRLTGPFPSQDAAMLAYAQDHVVDDWWIADLHAPENNG
jgi:hypothetical protein